MGDRERWLRLVAIAVGGSLGTLARYEVARSLVASPSGVSWPTLSVNLTGSFLLGLLITLITERWPPTLYVRPFAAIGFCGGFTTFSTLMVETARRFQTGHAGWAVGYLAISLVAGVTAAGLGVALARSGRGTRARRSRSVPHPIPDPDSTTDLTGSPSPAGPPGGRSEP